MGGLSAGQSQSGRAGGGRGDPRGVRQGSEEQSVQDLEPDVLGVLFSASGDGGGDTQTAWRWDENPWGADDLGQGGPNGGGQEAGVKVEPIFHLHPMAIDRTGRSWTRWRYAGSGAGRPTG